MLLGLDENGPMLLNRCEANLGYELTHNLPRREIIAVSSRSCAQIGRRKNPSRSRPKGANQFPGLKEICGEVQLSAQKIVSIRAHFALQIPTSRRFQPSS